MPPPELKQSDWALEETETLLSLRSYSSTLVSEDKKKQSHFWGETERRPFNCHGTRRRVSSERHTTHPSAYCNKMLSGHPALCDSDSSPLLHLCWLSHQLDQFIHLDIAPGRHVLSQLLRCLIEPVVNIPKGQRSKDCLSRTWRVMQD